MRRCAFVLWLGSLAVLVGVGVACAMNESCIDVRILAPVCAFCALGGGTAGCVAVCAEK